MKMLRISAVVSLFVLVAFPVFGAERRNGVGVGYNFAEVDIETAPEEFDFVGFSVFYKYSFNEPWGLLVSYRDMEDDEDFPFGAEIDYTQIGVHGVYMWRHGSTVRPHVKFGLVLTDIDITGSPSEDDTTISVGGGLEAGSEKFAFYGDFDYTEPEIQGFDFEIMNLTLGVIFKF